MDIIKNIKQSKKNFFNRRYFCNFGNKEAVITRFAPSPTGDLHLGSIRTAFYNYLLARKTRGKFYLRIEDTDQKRLKNGSIKLILESLKWSGIEFDSIDNLEYWIQSERIDIYKKYADILIEKGFAYRCYCSKERLDELRQSAMLLKPPTNVTYDRNCLYKSQVVEQKEFVVRFKSPDSYDKFYDLLNGKLNIQPQYNFSDKRYDDFVILKSDGYPTYQFANVIDDHLMKITHIIRGKEWLSSTPKHISLYNAFGWKSPYFVHIPLITSLNNKKFSKRFSGESVLLYRDSGIFSESILNFVALFGWSLNKQKPNHYENEIMSKDQLIKEFSLDGLTKGDVKCNYNKLFFFNKYYLNEKIKDPEQLKNLVDGYHQYLVKKNIHFDKKFIEKLIKLLGPSIHSLNQIETFYPFFFNPIVYSSSEVFSSNILNIINQLIENESLLNYVKSFTSRNPNVERKEFYESLRYALIGSKTGLNVAALIDLIGEKECKNRLRKFYFNYKKEC